MSAPGNLALARVRRRLFDDDSEFVLAAPDARRQALRAHVERLLLEEAPLLSGADVRRLAGSLVAEVTGFGPLEPLLADPSVVEIMVNGPGEVMVEREGRIEPAGVEFADEAGIHHLIEKVVGPLGLRADESRPIVDARLPDGSRFCAVVPPVALRSPLVTIRRFARHTFSLDDLVAAGSLPAEAAAWLGEAVRGRANCCICGGTSSGKTTFLNALSLAVPEGERIVTVEDSAELRLSGHVVGLEGRPPSASGGGGVSLRDLVRAALRLRPDRIVVGEVRDAAALDMLAALTTGHDGSLTTLHATSPAEAVLRLETFCLQADIGLPAEAARRQVALALDLFVQLERTVAGHRRVTRITRCRPGRHGEPELDDCWIGAHGTLQPVDHGPPPGRVPG